MSYKSKSEWKEEAQRLGVYKEGMTIDEMRVAIERHYSDEEQNEVVITEVDFAVDNKFTRREIAFLNHKYGLKVRKTVDLKRT
jgi:rRNA maturation endonuclease Nob1